MKLERFGYLPLSIPGPVNPPAWRASGRLCTAAFLLMATEACSGVKYAAVHEPNVIHVVGEGCSLGQVVIAAADGTVSRCTDYKPRLNHGAACADWKDPYVAKAMADFQQASGDVHSRVSQIDPGANVLAQVGHEGDVALVRGAIGIGMHVPTKAKIAGSAEKLDLLVRLRRLYLRPRTVDCLNAQTPSDLSRVVLNPGERVLGYVSQQTVGFAHYIHLQQVDVKTEAAGLVSLSAKSFSLSTKVQGKVEESYLTELEKLLRDLQGDATSIHASRLASGVDKILLPVTITVEVSPFRGTP